MVFLALPSYLHFGMIPDQRPFSRRVSLPLKLNTRCQFTCSLRINLLSFQSFHFLNKVQLDFAQNRALFPFSEYYLLLFLNERWKYLSKWESRKCMIWRESCLPEALLHQSNWSRCEQSVSILPEASAFLGSRPVERLGFPAITTDVKV